MRKNQRGSESSRVTEGKDPVKNTNSNIAVVIIAFIAICTMYSMKQEQICSKEKKPLVCVWTIETHNKGHLQHVYDLFERLGYQTTDDIDSDWDVLWTHDDPFSNETLDMKLRNLKPHQRVNKMPGVNLYVTQKMMLSVIGSAYIPKSFHFPQQQEEFNKYTMDNPDKLFVEKSIHHHGGVSIKSVDEVGKHPDETFVQEYVSNPLLIDGRKFDIGVYVVVASLDPLRVYALDGDVVFRFCAKPYEPFNSSILAKYVIGSEHYPVWKVQEIQQYLELSYEYKEAFETHIRSIGRDPGTIWKQIVSAIQHVFVERLPNLMIPKYKMYKHIKRSFFELMRFDFIVDKDFKIHLLEVNMSPNLSSTQYSHNSIIYDQILFSTLSLTGISSFFNPSFQGERRANEMMVAKRNVMVYPELCLKCADCSLSECQLCEPCLTDELLDEIKAAYRENKNQYRFKRVFPPRMTQEDANSGISSRYDNSRKPRVAAAAAAAGRPPRLTLLWTADWNAPLKGITMLANMKSFLQAIINVSEKAANIARACRREVQLFRLLVQEKSNEEKNQRFVQDFKTLADVLIQETVKHELGSKFPELIGFIQGEESNVFTNTLGETIEVKIMGSQEDTAELLSKVLDGDRSAADLLALEVHRDVIIDSDIPQELNDTNNLLPMDTIGIWIDPIDSTAEYIQGTECSPDSHDIYVCGLRCVTVLIGAYNRKSGEPMIGVVNQPFFLENGDR
ncbi:Hypothetical predicted protein [Cloeon dipterum]|uniref:Uncharacterized protein n=1 Tax=Cloeon dipterum TaxID=197152 RepID=A0A8S1DUC7_9INSE|nr:Hypothetical predicted protein [Cloeon dipterum]